MPSRCAVRVSLDEVGKRRGVTAHARGAQVGEPKSKGAFMVVDEQDRVARLVDAGRPLTEIEHDLIDPAPGLDEDERAALWLFAWAYQGTREPRSRLAESVSRS